MRELKSLTRNQTTKLNTYTKTQSIHQVSLGGPPNLSFNEKLFQEAVPPYQKALQNYGYRHTLTSKRPKNDNNSTNINKIKPNRKRQIIWFNRLFKRKMKTKFSKLFLNLLDKHLPPHKKMHRPFNRTIVKIGYVCMPNMNSYTSKRHT